jgi:hypothetical protein
MGTAVVKLELEDRVVEVEATPLQASISELFEHQAVWDVQTMSEKLGVDVPQTRNGLAFWANEGVVKEENGKWRLLEIAEEQPAATSETFRLMSLRDLADSRSVCRGGASTRKRRSEPGGGCQGVLAGMSHLQFPDWQRRDDADVSVHQRQVSDPMFRRPVLTPL